MDEIQIEPSRNNGAEGVVFYRGDRPDPWLLAHILDEIDYGVAVVSASGRLLHANRTASGGGLRSCGLRVCSEHVVASEARDQSGLAEAIGRALQGRRSMLTLQRGGARSLAVVPLAGGQEGEFGAALLVLGKDEVCQGVSLEFFARAHRLTTAELSVLRGLCEGLTPAQLAHRIGVALSTIRTQIGSVRAKTACASIREVVRRVVVLPPILLALRPAPGQEAPAPRA